jgi:hypothetical protein
MIPLTRVLVHFYTFAAAPMTAAHIGYRAMVVTTKFRQHDQITIFSLN